MSDPTAQATDVLHQIAVLVAPDDLPLELIEATDVVDLVNHVVTERDRLRQAATLAVTHLGGSVMPAPSILLAMSSYLRAALQAPTS
jgi:hypothetical protein